MKKAILAFALLVCISACNTPENNASNTTDPVVPEVPKQLVFEKLTGTWQSEDGKSFEQWTKNENGTYQSVAFSVKGNDTSWNEQAKTYPENNNWVFENTVKGQNDGKAVKFVSSLLTEKSVQFTNPEHDFPTDINYTLADANTIHAFIIGPNSKGGKDTIPFNFTRVK
ncbi:MAG: DUF6265 family protein [Bacteroidota bacterium]